MKKILSIFVLLIASVALYAQSDVTKFLGIPVDGYKTEMIQKLKAKGFTVDPYDKDVLQGGFNGEQVCVFVVTNNNKVCRIILIDKNAISETGIKIRFNKLCRQFENNSNYVTLEDFTISDDEDISYEMSVNKKIYEAVYYQKPDPVLTPPAESSACKTIQIGDYFFSKKDIMDFVIRLDRLSKYADKYGFTRMEDIDKFAGYAYELARGIVDGTYTVLDDFVTIESEKGFGLGDGSNMHKNFSTIRKEEDNIDSRKEAKQWRKEKELRNLAMNYILQEGFAKKNIPTSTPEQFDKYLLNLVDKKPVWFVIEKDEEGGYFIVMCYDNEYNKTNGEDL